MKITIHQILALPDQEQYDIVFRVGDYIDKRMEENRGFALYAVDMFYVEVENKVVYKRAFITGEVLDKYIKM